MWFRQRFETGLCEDLLPRRISTDLWASTYPINRTWILEGRVTGSDSHTWLRTTQLQGNDLCVLGCSLDACRVCAEAWHSGFKPVLVLLEDCIADGARSAVLKAAEELGKGYFRVGQLQCGFQVIVTHSKQVTLSLDSNGQPVDVRIVSEGCRQCFKGPAIVLGPVLRPEMDRTFCARDWDVHLQRVAGECAAVRDPQFWEERYDPECLPCGTPTYSTLAGVCLVWGTLSLAWFLPFRWPKDPLFGVLRCTALMPNTLVSAPCMVITISQIIGVQTPTMLFSKYSILMGIFFFLAPIGVLSTLRFDNDEQALSEFAMISAAAIVGVHAILAYGVIVARVRINRWSLLWAFTAMQGTGGSWASAVPILLLYQYLLKMDGTLAALYLTIAVSLSEHYVVFVTHRSYKQAVADRRRADPDCVAGDQKWSLTTALAATHAFSETTRLASLLCGAIAATDANFLLAVAVSLASTVALNTMTRTTILARFEMYLPMLGRLACPSSTWAVHSNARFAMGWSRFMVTLTFMLGRGLIHCQWEASMLVQDGTYGTWCWSGLVLITVCAAFFAEIVEDLLVYWLTARRIVVPLAPAYTEVMHKRLQAHGNYDLSHYFIPAADSAEGIKAEELVLAPNIRTVRAMEAPVLYVIMCACFCQFVTLVGIGVGSGNLLGYCRPLNLDSDNFVQHVKSAFLWRLQCDL